MLLASSNVTAQAFVGHDAKALIVVNANDGTGSTGNKQNDGKVDATTHVEKKATKTVATAFGKGVEWNHIEGALKVNKAPAAAAAASADCTSTSTVTSSVEVGKDDLQGKITITAVISGKITESTPIEITATVKIEDIDTTTATYTIRVDPNDNTKVELKSGTDTQSVKPGQTHEFKTEGNGFTLPHAASGTKKYKLVFEVKMTGKSQTASEGSADIKFATK